jgi:peptide/nickel transport system substrate-binding protein
VAANRRVAWVLALIVVCGLLLEACSPAATPAVQTVVNTVEVSQQVVQKQTVVVKQTVVQQATPTYAPAPPTPAPSVRTGAWEDQLIFTAQESAAAAVAQLKADDIDLFAWGVSDPAVFETVKADPNLSYTSAAGSMLEITCNPVAAFADGRINPFGVARFREALNWLFDRNYIAQEIYGGLAVPRTLPLISFYPDYARYVDLARPLSN